MGKRTKHWLASAVALASLTACADDAGGDLSVRIQGSTSVGPLAMRMAEAYVETHPGAVIDINITDSGDGVRAVGAGEVDIGMASRALSSSELMTYSGLVPVAVGRDAIAVVVHPSNTVRDLTLDELSGIYAGTITDWSAVGGAAGPIRVFVREEGSGTRDFFAGVVLDDTPVVASAVVVTSGGMMRDMVAADPSAIGFASFGSVNQTVMAIGIDVGRGPIRPTEEAVRTEQYPITRPLLFIHSMTPSEDTEVFVDFALSPSAQELATEMGYVSVL